MNHITLQCQFFLLLHEMPNSIRSLCGCGWPVPQFASCSQHALPRDLDHVLCVHKEPGDCFKNPDVCKPELKGEQCLVRLTGVCDSVLQARIGCS